MQHDPNKRRTTEPSLAVCLVCRYCSLHSNPLSLVGSRARQWVIDLDIHVRRSSTIIPRTCRNVGEVVGEDSSATSWIAERLESKPRQHAIVRLPIDDNYRNSYSLIAGPAAKLLLVKATHIVYGISFQPPIIVHTKSRELEKWATEASGFAACQFIQICL
jgi:hypothetical protein